jgi:hypothetical protein
MSERPGSVTLVCWLLLLFALVGLIPAYTKIRAIEAHATFPLHSSVYATLPILALAIAGAQVIMALGMFEGQNWARVAFIFVTPVTLLAVFLEPGWSHGFRLLYYLVFLAVLTRPAATRFFHQGGS